MVFRNVVNDFASTAWFSLMCSMILLQHIDFPQGFQRFWYACVSSLPPHWIHYQFIYEKHYKCVCELPPSDLDSLSVSYENNKKCVCVCGLLPPSLDSLYFSMKTIGNVLLCVRVGGLLPYSLDSLSFAYLNNEKCVCVCGPCLLPGFLTVSLWKQ